MTFLESFQTGIDIILLLVKIAIPIFMVALFIIIPLFFITCFIINFESIRDSVCSFFKNFFEDKRKKKEEKRNKKLEESITIVRSEEQYQKEERERLIKIEKEKGKEEERKKNLEEAKNQTLKCPNCGYEIINVTTCDHSGRKHFECKCQNCHTIWATRYF